jgi:hypothetical protein
MSDLMTPIQIADFLGYTTTTVNHLLQVGRIPSVAVGEGRQRIHRLATRENVAAYKAGLDARKARLADAAAKREARRAAREAKRHKTAASAQPVEPALPFPTNGEHGVRKALKQNTDTLLAVAQRITHIEERLTALALGLQDIVNANVQTRNLIALIARELGVKELQ